MAIVHADNFSLYGGNTSFMANGVYASVNGALPADPDGVSPGYVWQILNGFRHILPSSQTTVGIAQRVWLASLPSNDTSLVYPFVVSNAAGVGLVRIAVDPTGALGVDRGTDSGITPWTRIATTPGPVITANGWYHIEVKFVSGITNDGIVEIRVEGATVLEITNFDYFTADIAMTANGRGVAFPPNIYIKDYVVWTGQGSDNNDFLGSVLVTQLNLDADVALNWTPSTGATGYGILDNIPPVDSQFLSAPYDAGGPPYFPDPYVGSMTSLPVETTSVRALVTYVRAAKSDGGDGSLQVGLISDPDGTPATVLGADRPITVAQTYWRDVFERDPVTDAAWLPSSVNEVHLQLDRTS